LVVEVADTTLKYDLEVKRPLYARAGVAELWIVDIDRRELHLLRGPGLDSSSHSILVASDKAAVAALDDFGFGVSGLFLDS
jgi:Uma2 family endonuclease